MKHHNFKQGDIILKVYDDNDKYTLGQFVEYDKEEPKNFIRIKIIKSTRDWWDEVDMIKAITYVRHPAGNSSDGEVNKLNKIEDALVYMI